MYARQNYLHGSSGVSPFRRQAMYLQLPRVMYDKGIDQIARFGIYVSG